MDLNLKNRLLVAAVDNKFDNQLCRDIYNSYPVLKACGGVDEWMKLRTIGGCKMYHQEGDALTHTMMVYVEILNHYEIHSIMAVTALLHDVGKIYTGVQNAEGDWSYPYHSVRGAEELKRFVNEKSFIFGEVEWLVRNHIRPLFWQEQGVNTSNKDMLVGDDNLVKLATLALCDIRGSISATPQTELIKYLQQFINDHVQNEN